MTPLIRFATLLVAYTLLAAPAFGGDWSSVLPPDSPEARQKNVPRQEKTMKVGDVVNMPLPGNRSYTCPVEVDGDSVRIVSNDMFENLTLQAARPGLSTVRIFRKFWRDPDVRESYVPVQEIAIRVAAGPSRNLIGTSKLDRKEVPPPRLKGSMDWEGSISLQSEELLTVITADKEWTALWRSAFNRPAPKVDFGKYAVACVFPGYNAEWLYDIHIGGPRVEGNTLIIEYDMADIILELSGPFRASGQYRMKAVEKKKGYGMILEKIRKDPPESPFTNPHGHSHDPDHPCK